MPWGFEDVYPVVDECIWDEDKQRQYLDSFNMRLLVEDQTFEQDEYGMRSISRRSRFHQQQVSAGSNVWIEGFFKRNMLEDESDYLQYG